MTKDEQIEALQERLSQTNLVIDVVVSKLQNNGLIKNDMACDKLTKEADKNESLLIKLELLPLPPRGN